MNDEKSLDKIKDSIESIFSGRKVRTRSDRWTEKKQEFLAKLEALLDDKPFAEPVTRDVMDGLIIELQKLKQINQNLSKANLRLSRTVDDLSALKDADTVRLVKKKHGLTKEKDEFISLVKRVSTALNEFHPSIITCIYNSYTGHDLRIDFQLYANRIDEAISRDYIDSEQDVLWNETAEMEEVSSSLSELENCLLSLPEITRTELEKEYNCKLKTNNLKFWETVINAKLYYE